MHMVLMVLPGIVADKQQPQSRQRGDARHPLRSAPVGTCSSPVACAYFFRHSSGGRSGFFALLGRWCFESSRVAKDTESLGIEALAFGKTEDEVEAEEHARVAGAAPSVRRELPKQYYTCRASDAGDAGAAGRALRTQRLHSRDNLEYRFIRSNGASSRANSWRNARPLNLKA